jgi:uncharacterized protein YndB with AHSA1/START domain
MRAAPAVVVDEAVIVMSRVFDAPRALVWRAMTEPEHLAQWWGGHGFSNPVCEMDVRPGGLWHHVMRTPDGTEHEFNFVYLEVEAPKKLVWKNAEPGKSECGPPASVAAVTLEDLGAQTKWTLVARFNSIAERDLAVQMGFGNVIAASNERLAAHLKRL